MAADRITSLPGLNSSVFAGLGFEQYAGFVNISNTSLIRRDIFYWMVESQGSPSSDPILLWTNGGPGCSGLLGALTENGPFRAAQNGTTLYRDAYSWNRNANVIFVEQPLFVGYSFSDDPGDSITNDELNAKRLVSFIVRVQRYFRTL